MARSTLGLMPTAKVLARSRYEPEQIMEAAALAQAAAPPSRADVPASRSGTVPALPAPPSPPAATIARTAAAIPPQPTAIEQRESLRVPVPPAPPSAPAATIARTAAAISPQPTAIEQDELPRAQEPLSIAVAPDAPPRPPDVIAESTTEMAEPHRPRSAVAKPLEPAAIPPLPASERRRGRRTPETQPQNFQTSKPPAITTRQVVIDEPPLPQAPIEASLPLHRPTPRARLDERVIETAAEEPPPSIHVTIGRVEVRAAAPPPPEPLPAPSKPRVSLDDYLRAQKERSR
jgi:hypothetical protein